MNSHVDFRNMKRTIDQQLKEMYEKINKDQNTELLPLADLLQELSAAAGNMELTLYNLKVLSCIPVPRAEFPAIIEAETRVEFGWNNEIANSSQLKNPPRSDVAMQAARNVNTALMSDSAVCPQNN
tara:strand:- start:1508 stop:1885 length:378 start_codon:yes stop_codon:yes gene_type:complete